MIPQNIYTLINALTEKTDAKHAIWEKTSRPNEFKIILGAGALTIDNWEDNKFLDYFEIAIYNNNGDKIEKFIVTNDDDDEFLILQDLHNSVKREYYKVDETITSLLNEIETEDSIGKRDEFPF